MQKPKWRFTLSNEQIIILQTLISLDSVTIFVNDESIETRELSGYETIIPIELYDKTFTLFLQKKPVGGYNYSLETQNGDKLPAYDSEPTIAVSHQAEKVANSSEGKKGSRIPLLAIGFILGGCLGIVFILIGIGVYESNRSRNSKIALYVILTLFFLTWDAMFIITMYGLGRWIGS